MSMLFVVLGFFGVFIFLIIAAISSIKRTGKSKQWFVLSGISLGVFLISLSYVNPPKDEVNSASSKISNRENKVKKVSDEKVKHNKPVTKATDKLVDKNKSSTDIKQKDLEKTKKNRKDKGVIKQSEIKQSKNVIKIKTQKKNGDTKKAPSLSNGKNTELKDDVFVGVGETKDNYNEMFDYITAGNQEGLKRMALDGRIVYAAKGTPITIVDMGVISVKIEIIKSGIRGWVPIELLSR